MRQRKGVCFKAWAGFADGCGASCWPGALSPGQPAWRLVSRRLSCWARSRPGCTRSGLCSLRIEPCPSGSLSPPRGLWHLSRGLRVLEPPGHSGLCVWTFSHANCGAAPAGTPALRASSADRAGAPGALRSRSATTRHRGLVEVAGLSHGFLMVQIEVSLLPLRVGRSRQAGRGSAMTALPPVKPAAGLGLRSGRGRAPTRGIGDARRLHGGQAHVWAVTLAGRLAQPGHRARK